MVTPCTTDPIWLVLSSLGKPYSHRQDIINGSSLISLFLLLSSFEWARSVSDDSFIAFYAGRLSRPLCIDMPPYPSHSYDIFLHFQVFLSSVLACLHPFLKKAASCRESRHKLLTFPPPRNSRAILSLSLREGEKKAGKGRAYGDGCVSYGSRSLAGSWGTRESAAGRGRARTMGLSTVVVGGGQIWKIT